MSRHRHFRNLHKDYDDFRDDYYDDDDYDDYDEDDEQPEASPASRSETDAQIAAQGAQETPVAAVPTTDASRTAPQPAASASTCGGCARASATSTPELQSQPPHSGCGHVQHTAAAQPRVQQASTASTTAPPTGLPPGLGIRTPVPAQAVPATGIAAAAATSPASGTVPARSGLRSGPATGVAAAAATGPAGGTVPAQAEPATGVAATAAASSASGPAAWASVSALVEMGFAAEAAVAALDATAGSLEAALQRLLDDHGDSADAAEGAAAAAVEGAAVASADDGAVAAVLAMGLRHDPGGSTGANVSAAAAAADGGAGAGALPGCAGARPHGCRCGQVPSGSTRGSGAMAPTATATATATGSAAKTGPEKASGAAPRVATAASARAAPLVTAASSPAPTPPPPPPPPPPPRPSTQLNLAVVGHVDAGKSTLMGRLLHAAGSVDAKAVHRASREAEAVGKPSFRYAFLLDRDVEERARGVTIEVGAAFFEAGGRQVNVLDAPGHRDFVPNMIGAAAQADAAVLVLNASTGEFEAGLAGQTSEHVMLARCLGVGQLLVVVNQMDAVGWARERYEQLRAGIGPMLKQVGFASPPTRFVPVSALEGHNLTSDSPPPPAGAWYDGPALLDAICELTPSPRASAVGIRICVNDVFKGSATAGALVLSGTVQSGGVCQGDRLLLLPSAEQVTIKSLSSRGVPAADGTAGDHVEVGLAASPLDASAIGSGAVLCEPLRPARVARVLEVQLRTLPHTPPLAPGAMCELYCHAACVPAVVAKLLCGLDKRGERLAGPKPRVLVANAAALVQMRLEQPLVVELHHDCRPLGRIVLREAGRTVAAGLIVTVVR